MSVRIGGYVISPNRAAFRALAFAIVYLVLSWAVGVLAFYYDAPQADPSGLTYHFLAVLMGGVLIVLLVVLAFLIGVFVWSLFNVEPADSP